MLEKTLLLREEKSMPTFRRAKDLLNGKKRHQFQVILGQVAS